VKKFYSENNHLDHKMNVKKTFLINQAQISKNPIGIEVSHAKDIYIYDTKGHKYIDLIAGVSACTLGHSNKKIIKAINQQLNKHTHVMVYGEYIQKPQLKLADALAKNLPEKLNCSYFVNSGTEAIEGAIKLAKRITKKYKIVYCKDSYHGSTHGSLSYMGSEDFKTMYRPLLSGGIQIEYNNMSDLNKITEDVAAVIIEPIQGGKGFIAAEKKWLKEIKKICTKNKNILIFDEIQTCFGRTGKLFGFENYNVTPDILCLAKGMGGGMPIGCFISSHKNMSKLSEDPPLGHITTFGGHPIGCVAALTTLNELKRSGIIKNVLNKEKIFRDNLKHKEIVKINGKGLMLAVKFRTKEFCEKVIKECHRNKILTFYFLKEKKSMRISPPLNIKKNDIVKSCKIIIKAIENCIK